MSKEELLEELREASEYEDEFAHMRADELLLRYIDAEAMHTALSRYEALRRLVDRREWANKQVPSV